MPRDTVEEFHLLLPMTAKAPSPAASDDVLRVLHEGKRLIQQPEHWVQGPFAMNIERCSVSWSEGAAVSFCSAGALRRAASNLNLSARSAREYLMNAATAMGAPAYVPFSCVPHINFNDAVGRSHTEVMSMWDRAISSRLAEIEG